jgi:NOL1/NOP2/fmu family ribosome biogenesis protein
VPVFKIDRGEMYRPTHYAWLIFWDRATRHVLEWNDEQMQEYVLWKNLPANEKPWIPYKMVTWRGYGMTTTKWVNGEWKNKYGK